MTFVPTVVINGSQDHQKNLLKNLSKGVCDAFNGSEKPSACDV